MIGSFQNEEDCPFGEHQSATVSGKRPAATRYISRIEDAYGKVIYKAGAPEGKEVWSPEAAFIISV